MDYSEDQVYTLIDENGEEVEFYLVETTKFGGCDYYLFEEMDLSEEQMEDEDYESFLIMKHLPDDEEGILIPIEDDNEEEAVKDIFIELLDEEGFFDEEDEE